MTELAFASHRRVGVTKLMADLGDAGWGELYFDAIQVDGYLTQSPTKSIFHLFEAEVTRSHRASESRHSSSTRRRTKEWTSHG